MDYYVGIDLGGTNVRIAKVDDEGRIVEDVIAPSHGLEGPEKIEENIWNYDYEGTSDVIKVYIHHLRKKIDGDYMLQ